MKPLIHAKISVKTHGGTVEDYLPIHNFIDSSKAALPDMRHRAVLHSSFGIYVAEQVFGVYITNSAGKQISVRDIAEEHVLQDLGCIPTIERWFKNMKLEPWMSGTLKRTKTFDLDSGEEVTQPDLTKTVLDGAGKRIRSIPMDLSKIVVD